MGLPSYGDYDHCINALRQLQKRVTVNLIYDHKKELQNKQKSSPKISEKFNLKIDEEDSIMEDMIDKNEEFFMDDKIIEDEAM